MKKNVTFLSLLTSLFLMSGCSGVTSRIKTIHDLNNAITSTYIYGVFEVIVFVLIMLLIASQISFSYAGKTDNSWKKRTVWFYIILVITVIASFVTNYFVFYRRISNPQYQNTYLMHMAIAAAVALTLYFVIGFVIIKIRSNKPYSKVGTIKPLGK